MARFLVKLFAGATSEDLESDPTEHEVVAELMELGSHGILFYNPTEQFDRSDVVSWYPYDSIFYIENMELNG